MTPARSHLSVPGHVQKMHKKAMNTDADRIMLDLEDSVPVSLKEDALAAVVQTLEQFKPDKGRVNVRINPADTPLAYKEVVTLVEKAGPHITALVIPKVNHPGDIHFVSRLLDGVEQSTGQDRRIGIEAGIETAKGLEAVSDIASASPRLISLVFGVADYSASIGVRLSSLSGHGDDQSGYPGHQWHYPVSRMVSAAKANDLLAVDAPYGDFKDPDGLRRSAKMAAALGCDGKWVIHPDQIEIVNEVFTPSTSDIKRAEQVLAAVKKAEKIQRGAIAVDGQMIDRATVRLAERVWDQAVFLGLVDGTM